jgi:hypothetical protein
MELNIFKIKKTFLAPFIVMVLLIFLLLMLSLFKGQPWEKIILAVFFFATVIVGIEAVKREIIVTNDGLKIKKFFRVRDLAWSEVTHLGVVDLNKKAYFLLTTTKGFYFFSNMFENHALLIRYIVDKLETEKVEIEIKNYLEHPKEQHSLIVICWLMVLIIIVFIILKILSA